MSTVTQTKPSTQTKYSTHAADEAEIRGLISAWSRALEAKDLDGLVANYLPDALVYDVKPPHRTEGPAAIRQVWAACLPFFPDRFQSEHRDLKIAVGGDVAFVHGLHHMKVIDQPDHPAGQSWVRVTSCYRKVNGRWKVAHEHVSIPFDCATGRVSPITDPA